MAGKAKEEVVVMRKERDDVRAEKEAVQAELSTVRVTVEDLQQRLAAAAERVRAAEEQERSLNERWRDAEERVRLQAEDRNARVAARRLPRGDIPREVLRCSRVEASTDDSDNAGEGTPPNS